jgi:hypothetical protein
LWAWVETSENGADTIRQSLKNGGWFILEQWLSFFVDNLIALSISDENVHFIDQCPELAKESHYGPRGGKKRSKPI